MITGDPYTNTYALTYEGKFSPELLRTLIERMHSVSSEVPIEVTVNNDLTVTIRFGGYVRDVPEANLLEIIHRCEGYVKAFIEGLSDPHADIDDPLTWEVQKAKILLGRIEQVTKGGKDMT